MIALGQVAHLILTHKDRLLRFGAEIIFSVVSHSSNQRDYFRARPRA